MCTIVSGLQHSWLAHKTNTVVLKKKLGTAVPEKSINTPYSEPNLTYHILLPNEGESALKKN